MRLSLGYFTDLLLVIFCLQYLFRITDVNRTVHIFLKKKINKKPTHKERLIFIEFKNTCTLGGHFNLAITLAKMTFNFRYSSMVGGVGGGVGGGICIHLARL